MVYVVQGMHWNVPGVPLTLHATKQGADKEAASLVEIMRRECDIETPASVSNWEDVLIDVQDCQGAQYCDVWITEAEVRP